MRYLIIGNSAAATGAIESLRSIDPDGEIVVVAIEPQHVYARPLISYYLAGQTERKNMFFRPADFYEQNRVKTFLGEAAVSLSASNKTIRIEPSGLDLNFDRLLIATGGKPILPTCFSGDYRNLYYFHQWQDVEQIAAAISPGQKALIVGGGLIGLKATESLTKRGLQVQIVEAAPHLLPSVLDAPAGDLVKRYLQTQGVEILLGNPVVELKGEKLINSVVLTDGTEINCDLLVMAAGVRPNIDWLNNSVQIDKGILVDEYMASSQADVYAAGDVAQSHDRFSVSTGLTPLWPFAYRQGRVAGANMAGQVTPHQPEPAFNSLPLLGLNIVSAGLSSTLDPTYEYMIERKDPWHYKKLVIAENRLIGFIFTGDISRAGIYRFLIEEEIDLSSFKQQLLTANFGMIDLPVQYRVAK
jgi:NAD(P)H-nitrite reductase large subunit